MSPEKNDPRQTVWIATPTGRDGVVVRDLLQHASIEARICSTPEQLPDCIAGGAAAVLVAEEALGSKLLSALADFASSQPAWSDLPFIVLSSDRRQPELLVWRQNVISALRNVTLLERPVQGLTLVSTMKSALRARSHQYEVQELLERSERSATELANMVEHRTRELVQANEALQTEMAQREQTEERLRQAQKMEAIGQLTGGIAHDFNNLLMVISGGLNMLEKRPARAAEMIDAMKKSTARGARLTHQLLAFSRRQNLKPEPLDLKAFFREVAELLDRSLRGDVHVKTQVPNEAWPIDVDPGEFQLAILNLAVNARDAMPQGGTVSIEIRNIAFGGEDNSGEYVQISVSDTGSGMTAETAKRVFEPYFTTKEIGKGSGLGLAQVHGFVTQSGGTIDIASEVGAGTSVIIHLPRSRFLPKGLEQPAAESAATSLVKKGAVLLVEDQDEVGELVSQMLYELGYEVIRASSAVAALGALANERPVDFVLTDVMMSGGMDGLELSRRIRQQRPNLPVLLTSGYADSVRLEAEREGVPLLPKPYQLDELGAAIQRLLPRSDLAPRKLQ